MIKSLHQRILFPKNNTGIQSESCCLVLVLKWETIPFLNKPVHFSLIIKFTFAFQAKKQDDPGFRIKEH